MECLWPQVRTTKRSGTVFQYRHRCGKCPPCARRRREQWTARILLEGCFHKDSVFVTLTYDEYNIPENGNVNKRDLQLFFKRLRKARGPFRYFACAEYGERTFRAHYHCILFGVPLHEEADIVRCWNKGFVHTAELNVRRARYVARYTTKKLAGAGDDSDSGSRQGAVGDLAEGSALEFRLMSRRPGIGMAAVEHIAGAGKKYGFEFGGYRTIRSLDGDLIKSPVPTVARIEGRRWSLDQYMIKQIRKLTDIQSDEAGLLAIRHLNKLVHERDPLVRKEDGKKRKAAEVRTIRDSRPAGFI